MKDEENFSSRVRAYDKAAYRSWGVDQRNKFAYLCEFYPRVEGDGNIPGVYMTRQVGDRCIWSAKWSTFHGILLPDHVLPTSAATIAQLLAELCDAANMQNRAFQSDAFTKAGGLAAEFYSSGETLKLEYWAERARQVLGDARKAYPEYILPGDPPEFENVYVWRIRSEWDRDIAWAVSTRKMSLIKTAILEKYNVDMDDRNEELEVTNG